MRLAGVTLLAADTPRSQAYAQHLLHNGFQVDAVVLFEKPGQPLPGQGCTNTATLRNYNGIFLPDMSIPLKVSCSTLAKIVIHRVAKTVNDPVIVETVQGLSPKLVIYSGFGGQIVGDSLLKLGPRFLHMHSGWLPDYRGSTTIYYSLLKERRCGVSAILLRKEIDVGEIVLRDWFPAPAPRLDIDYVYDSAIRAHVLTKVMETWAEQRSFSAIRRQAINEGETYYVIHPVLKHLAILGLT